MQAVEKKPLILTLRLDAESQAFFESERELYFPPERNLLKAHLTLFHHLPDEPLTYAYLAELAFEPFEIQTTGLINLGAGGLPDRKFRIASFAQSFAVTI